MDANDSYDGKPTNLNCFYMHTIFELKYLKPAIVSMTYLQVVCIRSGMYVVCITLVCNGICFVTSTLIENLV